MNRTVTIDEFARTVARLTESSEVEALLFVREAFMLAAETLKEGETVDVPHVGGFVAIDGQLRFRPDEELAEALNAPFSAFSAMEIDDPSALVEPEISGVENPLPIQEPEPEPEPEPEIAGIENPLPMPKAEPEVEPEPEPVVEPVVEETHTETVVKKSHASDWIMPLVLAVICLTVGFVMGRLSAPRHVITIDSPLPAPAVEEPAAVDSIAEPAEPAEPIEAPATEQPKAPVTDTIGLNRYLTTMAREHYGQMEYWVYIYLENEAKLGHPDRLSAGTTVVIPPAEKYGLVAGDKAKIAEAVAKAQEVYSRFR